MIQDEDAPEQTDDLDHKWKLLDLVLEKSAIYSRILREQMEKHKMQMREQERPTSHPSKRRKLEDSEETSLQDNGQTILFQQPALVTGAKLKNYQLEGLQWMVALHQNGISGILGSSTSTSFRSKSHFP
jgi:ATP-dependent DNA helicase